MDFFVYLLIMAGSTCLIRAVPFAVIPNKIENRFVKSFLYYVPYAVLSAMTVPAVFYATDYILSAADGLLFAVLFAFREKNLTIVAATACIAVFVTEGIIGYLIQNICSRIGIYSQVDKVP